MASITKKATSGFLVRWREDGKQRNRYFPTHQEALDFKARLEDGKARSGGVDARYLLNAYARKTRGTTSTTPTLAEYALELSQSRDLSEGTQRFYRVAVTTHIAPTPLGQMQLSEIQPLDIQRWWDGLEAGDGARGNALRIVIKTFRQAERLGLISRDPTKRAAIKSPSRRRKKELTILEPHQIDRLVQACANQRDRVGILLAAYGGLRAGEVGGLRVQDVDFDNCRVSIRQATYRNGGKGGIGSTKTRGSSRTIRIAPQACEALREYVSKVQPWSDGRILYTPRGGTIDHILLNRKLHEAAKRAGLPPVNFHALRHTCAAYLIRANVPVKAIQHHLGHSSIQMTMDVYGHLMAGADDVVGEALERAFINTGGSDE